MPYPLAPTKCRLCRELADRQVSRVVGITFTSGTCPRCYDRRCKKRACQLEMAAHSRAVAPCADLWGTLILPRVLQRGVMNSTSREPLW